MLIRVAGSVVKRTSASFVRLLHECDPSYRVLTLALVGLPPTEYAGFKLDTRRNCRLLRHYGVSSDSPWLGLDCRFTSAA
jgi:hypothetical protein